MLDNATNLDRHREPNVIDRRQSRIRGTGSGPRGVAADELRRHNLATILERLHLSGPTSRSELTGLTGLNRSTVAALIGELKALGLADEAPAPAPSGPGRPSPVVRVRPAGAGVLAGVMEGESIAVAVVGLGGHVYDRVRTVRPRRRVSPQDAVEEIVGLAATLLDSLQHRPALAGVGVAIAGITRRADGFVHLAPNLEWRDVEFGKMVAAGLDLGVPVSVANEADLGAIGEHRRGTARGVEHLIYVSGEVGIGAGVIIDGKPLLGAAGYAGEVGHMKVNPAGRVCQCGGVGCWETEAGEAALERLAGATAADDPLGADRAVMERAASGDEQALRALAEIGGWLGIGIANLVNVFNPQVVALGGLYQRLFPYLEDTMLESIGRNVLAAPSERVTIVPSALGPGAPLLGAAEVVLASVISDPAGFGARGTGDVAS